uniref:(northern house mosquito) hypothetical protein n=1 Tax=Culex pipiens TaxID=7175 RepID=A0A8D8FYX4_CULPI
MRASVASRAGDRLPVAATPQLLPLLLPDMLPYFFNVRAESRIDCFSPKIVSSSMAVAPVVVPPSETSFTNFQVIPSIFKKLSTIRSQFHPQKHFLHRFSDPTHPPVPSAPVKRLKIVNFGLRNCVNLAKLSSRLSLFSDYKRL